MRTSSSPLVSEVIQVLMAVSSVQAKQKAMEELTQGQAMTLVRNEQVIDRSAEEAEDLEEMLNESIADSLRGAKQKAAGQGMDKKTKKRYGS